MKSHRQEEKSDAITFKKTFASSIDCVAEKKRISKILIKNVFVHTTD